MLKRTRVPWTSILKWHISKWHILKWTYFKVDPLFKFKISNGSNKSLWPLTSKGYEISRADFLDETSWYHSTTADPAAFQFWDWVLKEFIFKASYIFGCDYTVLKYTLSMISPFLPLIFLATFSLNLFMLLVFGRAAFVW